MHTSKGGLFTSLLKVTVYHEQVVVVDFTPINVTDSFLLVAPTLVGEIILAEDSKGGLHDICNGNQNDLKWLFRLFCKKLNPDITTFEEVFDKTLGCLKI